METEAALPEGAHSNWQLPWDAITALYMLPHGSVEGNTVSTQGTGEQSWDLIWARSCLPRVTSLLCMALIIQTLIYQLLCRLGSVLGVLSADSAAWEAMASSVERWQGSQTADNLHQKSVLLRLYFPEP